MKRKFSTRLMCFIISGVLLSGALTVAALNGSPYETLKNAIFNAFTYDSFVLEGEFRLAFDDVVLDSDNIHIIVSGNNHMELQSDDFLSLTYDSLMINRSYRANDGTQWYSARVDRWGSRHNSSAWPTITQEDRDSARFRFAELFIDILVGDLKNNMYMTTSDGMRRISGAITHNQLPELIRVGIEMMLEAENRWWDDRYISRDDFSCPSHIPPRSLTFDHIGGEAYVDNMGNLTYLNVNVIATIVNVFGDHHRAEMSVELRFSEIGTAVVLNPIPGISELLTPEFIESVSGWRYSTVHFLRLEDGSIDPDSVIDTWPGNLRNQRNLGIPTSWCGSITCDWDLDFDYSFELIMELVERIEILIAEGNYEDALRILLDMNLSESDWLCSSLFDYLINLAMELSLMADLAEL